MRAASGSTRTVVFRTLATPAAQRMARGVARLSLPWKRLVEAELGTE